MTQPSLATSIESLPNPNGYKGNLLLKYFEQQKGIRKRQHEQHPYMPLTSLGATSQDWDPVLRKGRSVDTEESPIKLIEKLSDKDMLLLNPNYKNLFEHLKRKEKRTGHLSRILSETST